MLLTSCFKKAGEGGRTGQNQLVKPSAALRETGPKNPPKDVGEAKGVFNLLNKEQREAIYFAASLEKEALRIMTKNQFSDDMSLFSVLSFAVEIAAGIKKMSPPRLDCSRFKFLPKVTNANLIEVYKICEKPDKLVAQIQIGADPNHLTTTFFIKEWSAVVGLSVSVTGQDVVCDLQIRDKKLDELNCLNWTKNLIATDTSSEELKLKTFNFNRNQKNQFTVKGGLFKDLVERKKIEMHVPLQGRIKMIEKEIEVIDEFAEKPAPLPDHLPKMELKTETNKNKIEKLGDLIEKNGKEKENGNQAPGETNQEGQPREEQGQQQNQGETQKQNQIPNEIQNEIQNQNSNQIQINPEGRQDQQNGGIPPAGR